MVVRAVKALVCVAGSFLMCFSFEKVRDMTSQKLAEVKQENDGGGARGKRHFSPPPPLFFHLTSDFAKHKRKTHTQKKLSRKRPLKIS